MLKRLPFKKKCNHCHREEYRDIRIVDAQSGMIVDRVQIPCSCNKYDRD